MFLELPSFRFQPQFYTGAIAFCLITLRIDATSRSTAAEKVNAALELQQVWLDSLIADRWQAQEVMGS